MSHFGQKWAPSIFCTQLLNGACIGNLNNLGAYLIKFPFVVLESVTGINKSRLRHFQQSFDESPAKIKKLGFTIYIVKDRFLAKKLKPILVSK